MNKYIIMVFAGACSFGILSTFVKLAYQEGYTAAEISFSQAFFGMLVLWILSLLYHKKNKGYIPQPLSWASTLPLLLTGVAIGLTTFVYYLSVQYIPASVAIVILMQFTWIGMLLDWIFFRKKPGYIQLLTTALIVVGTLMASGMVHAKEREISKTGVLYAFGSALLYAMYVVANSRVGKHMHPIKKGAIFMSGSAMGIFVVNAPILINSHLFDFNLVRWALFLSLFGTIIPPLLFAKGIPKIGASISAIIMTVELPVAVTCSHLILKERVDYLQWTGTLVMLLSMALLHIQKVNWVSKQRQLN